MCFGGSSKPDVPKPTVLPPPVAPEAPPKPAQAPAAPQNIKVESQLGITKRKSSAEEAGTTSQGTSQLRIPLNVGTKKTGGLNV